MGQIEKIIQPISRTKVVRLQADENSVEADAALFQVAADTLREMKDHNLIDASFHVRPIDADSSAGNELHLYIEPA